MADTAEAKMEEFLRIHQAQLVSAQVPEHLWPIVYYKLKNEVFDAGNYFFLARDEDGDLHVVVRDDIDLTQVQPNSEEALFLVDHAWTFTAEKCLEQLKAVPALLERMENLMELSASSVVDEEDEDGSIPVVEFTHDERVERVMQRMWKYTNTYRIGNLKPEEASPIWYIMDEFGSAIEHSDAPNMRMAPFYFSEMQCAFSLLWPVQTLEGGDFLTRDYVPEQTQDHDMRTALLTALFYPDTNGDEDDAENEYIEELQQIIERRQQSYSLDQARATFYSIVSRDSETHPDPANTKASPSLEVAIANPEPLQVYSNLTLVYEHLKHPKFLHVESEEEAQVVWPTWHIKDFQKYATNERVQIINQFPNEKILTCKDLLFEMCKLQNNGKRPVWLAETYNMTSEFPELVDTYIGRDRAARAAEEADDEANHWICKPWNMARSIDTCIAQNLPHMARLTETGPKVACKYIHRPLLIDQRKFDFRFLVMVKSTEPLELYLSGVYWLRIANTPFSMDNFQDFEKHFTVMNYSQFGVRIMDNTEFVQRFENEYPSEDWSTVFAEIGTSIKQLFTFATASPPPMGLGRCAKSRALYGVDVMLSWETNEATGEEFIRPIILEVNFQPDCTRACKYFPQFYNDLMNVLVLNNPQEVVHGVTQL